MLKTWSLFLEAFKMSYFSLIFCYGCVITVSSWKSQSWTSHRGVFIFCLTSFNVSFALFRGICRWFSSINAFLCSFPETLTFANVTGRDFKVKQINKPLNRRYFWADEDTFFFFPQPVRSTQCQTNAAHGLRIRALISFHFHLFPFSISEFLFSGKKEKCIL